MQLLEYLNKEELDTVQEARLRLLAPPDGMLSSRHICYTCFYWGLVLGLPLWLLSNLVRHLSQPSQ
jgi:hypothetical protein